MEVLSPVKNLDVAKVVIQSGCDAIYLGSPNFSARNKVNIDKEQLELIIDYANSYCVKSFVAFNTVIFEDEIQKLLNEIIDVYNLGASGIILQDFSVASIIKEQCPNLELHASTQMNVHNSFSVDFLKHFNFNRIVVPREMTFERIKKLKDKTKIDIEAFIHGAICVSYSGQCYDSVLLDQKSANRGRCSQYCRFEQNVYKNDVKVSDMNFPLNIKDMNNSQLIEEYKSAGVDSLKIEGRLKDIDYAGVTASTYSGQNTEFNLNQVYNRTFTNGLINSTKTNELVNNERINNTGEYIGTVRSVTKNTSSKLNYYSYIVEIDNPIINKGDNIRFVNDKFEDGQVVEQIEGNKVYSNCEVKINDKVYRTSNISIYNYFNNLKNTFTRRNIINVEIAIQNNSANIKLLNKSFSITINYEHAKNHVLTTQYLTEMLSKTNNTPYTLNFTNIKIEENIYLSNKHIKDIKKFILFKINEELLIKRNVEYVRYKTNRDFHKTDLNYLISVKNIKQYNICKYYSSNIIISDLKLAKQVDINENLILQLPSIIYDDQIEIYEDLINKFKRLCVSDLGMYYKYKNTHEIITNYTLNSTNNLNLNNLKSQYNILSLELNVERINMCSNHNSVFLLYGYIPVMTMDYCPINKNKQAGCKSCTLCHNNEYYLKDFKNRKFKLIHEDLDKLCLYSEKPIYNKDYVDSLQINNYLIRFTIEEEVEVESVLKSIFENERLNVSYENKTLLKEVL